jgi:hypothetical protein
MTILVLLLGVALLLPALLPTLLFVLSMLLPDNSKAHGKTDRQPAPSTSQPERPWPRCSPMTTTATAALSPSKGLPQSCLRALPDACQQPSA